MSHPTRPARCSHALWLGAAATLLASHGSDAQSLNMPTLRGWGANAGNQISTPTGLTGVKQVACGSNHSYALKNDGTLAGWGQNNFNQLNTPAGLTGVKQVFCGDTYTYALKTDGTIIGWGYNSLGATSTPTGLSGIRMLACGPTHTIAVKSDGSIVGWGNGGYGQTTAPAGLTGVTSAAVGDSNTHALKSDGTLVGWGYNSYSQNNVPTGLSGVVQHACGYHHAYALKSDGSVVGWGRSDSGQTSTPAGLTRVTQVACGSNSTYALKQDGTVTGWGLNSGGQTNTPAGLVGIVQVACGAAHTYALLESDCDADGVVDSTALAAGTVADRNGNLYPDTCDVARGWEEDCNHNGVIDSVEQAFNATASASSGSLPRIGFGHPQQWTYASPSYALNDPLLTVQAYGDFSAPGETLTVALNGRFVATLLADGSDKNDCAWYVSRTITLPRAFYNECVASPGGATDAVLDFTTSIAVNADQCISGSWVRASLSYVAAVPGDCNANSLLDACEIVLDASLDGNHDGVIDACQGNGVIFSCPGDLDGSGNVGSGDLSLMLLGFGLCMPGDPADLDGDGAIAPSDIAMLLLNYGEC